MPSCLFRIPDARNDDSVVRHFVLQYVPFIILHNFTDADDIGEREIDFFQNRDLDLILTERATRFYDPKLSGIEKEKCILVAVDTKLETRRAHVESAPIFSLKESLR